MATKRNRKRKPGSRRDKAETKAAERNAPNAYIQRLRAVFSFVTPTKVEGKVGTIDQDICDAIGQLHALGLLDGHGHDPQDMRDAAREWRNGYLVLMTPQACKISKYERADKGHKEPVYTKADERWDLMDGALTGYERQALMDLLVDPDLRADSEIAPWARSIIDEALLKRGRIHEIASPMRFADANDWALLAAAIRGCCMLVDAKLPQRRAA